MKRREVGLWPPTDMARAVRKCDRTVSFDSYKVGALAPKMMSPRVRGQTCSAAISSRSSAARRFLGFRGRLPASAQITSKVYRLGTLGPRNPFDDKSQFGSILVRVLAERGFALGQNLALDARGAEGDMHRVPQLLQEMEAGKVDAFVVTGYPVAVAAKTAGIPTVVAFGAGDPVATGLVQSLSRPGGNITGISDNATELSTKRLSLLKQLNPKLRRVAMLWNKDDLGMSMRSGFGRCRSIGGRRCHAARRP